MSPSDYCILSCAVDYIVANKLLSQLHFSVNTVSVKWYLYIMGSGQTFCYDNNMQHESRHFIVTNNFNSQTLSP